MNILHTVEFYPPSVGGAQEVVRQISEHLVKRGHIVTVATTKLRERTSRKINGVQIEEFDIEGNLVNGIKGEVERYQKFLVENKFDIMMNYAAQQWATDLVFPILNELPYATVLAPCGFSGLSNTRYAGYYERLPEIMRHYDYLIFHSDVYQDVEFARKHGLSSYTIIPNGAASEEFNTIDDSFRQRYRISSDIPLLLTVGSHTGMKGHRLVLKAFSRARIGRAMLIIIGNTIGNGGCRGDCRRRSLWVKWTSMGRKQVLLLNPPRRDVVAAYHAADLFVFGSKTECSPLVLFESMAARTPFISLACGNAEEVVKWGNGGVILPTEQRVNGLVDTDPATMAGFIEKLILDPELSQKLGQNGYRSWAEKFTWEKLAGKYENTYKKILGGN